MIIFKKLSIKTRLYYVFSKMINIKNFDLVEYRQNIIYSIKHITMKSLDHVNIACESSFYLVFNNVDGYIIKESIKDKYLVFAYTDKKKEVLEKYTKLLNEIKNQIETINGGKPIEYKKDFMKISFELDDDLSLGKVLSIHDLIIVNKSVLQEGNNYYPQVFLHECGYESVAKL